MQSDVLESVQGNSSPTHSPSVALYVQLNTRHTRSAQRIWQQEATMREHVARRTRHQRRERVDIQTNINAGSVAVSAQVC